MSTALSAIPSGSSGALQAELQRAQLKLSDCVGCASAKTPSGQKQIAMLRAEVQGIEQRLEKVDQAEGARTASTPAAPALSPLGNFLDVYA